MKKLIISIFLILLLIILFFQFQNYRRLNPPTFYEYSINKNIDINYHNPVLVYDYYRLCYDIGSFSREQWYNYRIDVLFPDQESDESMKASEKFNLMKSKVSEIETRLLLSAKLKKEGFSNEEILEMETRGIGSKEYLTQKLFEEMELKIGDEGQAVLEMQKKLHAYGFKLRLDGIYNQETKAVVTSFQLKKGLVPSGKADKHTLMLLLKEN